MENKQSGEEDVSSAKAVFLGALAPGVNGPTWNTLKFSFLMLGLCLSAMLGLAFSSSDSWLILHVTILVLITGTLFMLLSRKVVVVRGTTLMMHHGTPLSKNCDNRKL
ncbi:uncharacterized protein LOC130760158 isoform X3 [Actinidia eriantha]|uniref:uncharacterized protein LOC130760158 isoform X3 n=1 Tax=Actinidia eriantha TaxID=165200 RepID=UPI00258CB938|nr:uncharacterized protein LOC130760158 isoform X3 [Actinidia eriantha]